LNPPAQETGPEKPTELAHKPISALISTRPLNFPSKNPLYGTLLLLMIPEQMPFRKRPVSVMAQSFVEKQSA
jgi:hypothetical protein